MNVLHQIPPVWNAQSKVLLLGTMPSPASRNAGFFHMHPQNRFWRVLPAVFGETLSYTNDGKAINDISTINKINNPVTIEAVVTERQELLLRHNIALWDVLASCNIQGASDSSIKNTTPNDFTSLFENSKITRVFCTGKTAFNLWQKLCAPEYEVRFNLKTECLPSTSPANAAWSLERLINEYYKIKECL